MLPRPKKKPAPFEDLLGGEEPMADDMGGEFEEEDEYSEDAGFDDVTEPMDDPLAAAGDDMGMGGLDPEQAQLAETLGFSDPEQQQALVDLIKLVAAPAPSPIGEF